MRPRSEGVGGAVVVIEISGDEPHLGAGPPRLSPHFVNNVLATAASYVEEDAGLARDVLADLGAFLAYRLREDLDPVPLGDELEFVRLYLRLEQARFGDRLETAVDEAPSDALATVRPLAVQEAVQALVTRRLRDRPGALRVAVRVAADGASVRLDASDLPDGGAPEREILDLRATG